MKNFKVLIVDDQEGIRRVLVETCVMLGYEVHSVAAGEEALELVKQGDFHVVMVDMKMPGMNGVNTIKNLLRQEKDLKIILMTGYSESELAEEVYRLKIDAIIKKPFGIEDVKELLEKVINN
ncbi:MAG: response regulator [Clostridia bacterium]|nr:response regulator [Clostridia bacterium]MDD4048143.1 response regulator [Clostridia bacterium]